jgi:hypothetical protein
MPNKRVNARPTTGSQTLPLVACHTPRPVFCTGSLTLRCTRLALHFVVWTYFTTVILPRKVIAPVVNLYS